MLADGRYNEISRHSTDETAYIDARKQDTSGQCRCIKKHPSLGGTAPEQFGWVLQFAPMFAQAIIHGELHFGSPSESETRNMPGLLALLDCIRPKSAGAMTEAFGQSMLLTMQTAANPFDNHEHTLR